MTIKTLKTYINSKQLCEEKARSAKTLGGLLKAHRIIFKMTQEFVAKYFEGSRKATSKCDSVAYDSGTPNLIAHAKLLDINPDDLLKEARIVVGFLPLLPGS